MNIYSLTVNVIPCITNVRLFLFYFSISKEKHNCNKPCFPSLYGVWGGGGVFQAASIFKL